MSLVNIRALRASLGLERNVSVMLIALLVLGLGEELWTRFVPKYLESLGAGVVVIGLYGALRDLLDALYPYPGGWVTDRLGRKHALVLFTALAIVGYVLYLASPGWEWILVGTVFVMAWSSLTLPTIFAIIGDDLPQDSRATGFGVQSILKRVPIVIAPLAGGALIAQYGIGPGMRIGLVITIVLAVGAIVFVLRTYRERARGPHDGSRFRDVWRTLDPRLKRLLLADGFVRWAEDAPKVFIILYVINVLHFSAWDFGVFTSLQMLVAILVYIPVAKLADRANRKPFVLLTFVFFALYPLLMVQAPGYGWLVFAFVVAGLREIGEPARKALIVDLAAETARGRVVGMYYLVRGLAVFPASLVGGWLWTVSPAAPFYFATAMGVMGIVLYAGTEPAHSPGKTA